MFIFDISNPLTLLLMLAVTILLIFLAKEINRSAVSGLALFGYLVLLVIHVAQLTTLPEEYRYMMSTITRCLAIDFVFILASLTDKLDGYIARSRNQVTAFGKFLDPLADKILVLAAMLMLVEMNKLPAWIPIIVLAREFLVSGYRLIAVEKGGEVIAASKWGKLKTVTQMLAIILAFLDLHAFGECFNGSLQGGDFVLNVFVTIMMIVQTIATIFSGIDYMRGIKKYIKD